MTERIEFATSEEIRPGSVLAPLARLLLAMAARELARAREADQQKERELIDVKR